MDTPNHLAPPNWIVGPRAVRVMASWVPWVPRSQVAKIGAADIIVVGLQATIFVAWNYDSVGNYLEKRGKSQWKGGILPSVQAFW